MKIGYFFKRFIKHYYAKIKTEEDNLKLKNDKDKLTETVNSFFREYTDEKKILFFAHEIKPLGASILLNNVAGYFIKNGYRIVILTNPGCEIDTEMAGTIESDALIIELHDDYDWDSFILKEIAANGVKRCLANTVISGKYIKMIKDQGIFVITLVHEMAASIKILKAENLVESIAEYSDIIVFPTEKAKEQFAEIAHKEIKGRCCIIAQGIYKNAEGRVFDKEQAKRELNKLFGIRENDKVLIGIGNINFGKGVDRLIPVLLELQKNNKGLNINNEENSAENNIEYHVIWLGKITDTAFYEWMSVEIRNSGLEKLWHWAGFISDETLYYKLLCASDVFALPSREDTYPSVALEAASVALPIAAFRNSGGGADIAVKQHGMLAESGDVVDYAFIIEKLLYCNEEISSKCINYAAAIQNDHNFLDYCKTIESFFLSYHY